MGNVRGSGFAPVENPSMASKYLSVQSFALSSVIVMSLSSFTTLESSKEWTAWLASGLPYPVSSQLQHTAFTLRLSWTSVKRLCLFSYRILALMTCSLSDRRKTATHTDSFACFLDWLDSEPGRCDWLQSTQADSAGRLDQWNFDHVRKVRWRGCLHQHQIHGSNVPVVHPRLTDLDTVFLITVSTRRNSPVVFSDRLCVVGT